MIGERMARPATERCVTCSDHLGKDVRPTVSNASNLFVGENRIFFVVRQATCLFNQCRWKPECKGLVVDKLRVEVIIHLSHTKSEMKEWEGSIYEHSTTMKGRI